MIGLFAALAVPIDQPKSTPVVFACEYYDSAAETDGVGSFVDLRAVRYPDDRWTLEFESGRILKAAWSWVKKEKGLGRLAWRDRNRPEVAIVHLIAGSESVGMPSFWLSRGEPPAVDGPGYMCNGKLEGGS
jgi:hypothetical protein